MAPNMVCPECREEKPYLMSCIHTFAPPQKSSPLGTYDRDEEQRTQREMDERARHPNW